MMIPLFALLALLLPTGAAAQEAAPFLKIGVGARALAMGQAATATAEGVEAVAWNPAGLADLPSREFGFTRVAMGEDTRYDFLGVAQPTRVGTFSAAVRHLGQGRLDGRDAAGKPTGGFSASDTAADLAYGVSVSSALRLGAGARYITSSIAEAEARGVALDLGGLYRPSRLGPGIAQVGVAVRNLGSRMRFADESSPLPLVLAAGASYRLPADLTLAMDYRYGPHAASSDAGFGAEWTHGISKGLSGSLRGGADLSRRDLGSIAVLSLGAGLSWRAVETSFAWRPGGALGDSFVYSLIARL